MIINKYLNVLSTCTVEMMLEQNWKQKTWRNTCMIEVIVIYYINSWIKTFRSQTSLHCLILKLKITLFLLALHCHSLPLDVPLDCLFIDDSIGNICTKSIKITLSKSQSLSLSSTIFDKYFLIGIIYIFSGYSWREIHKKLLSFAFRVWTCMFLNFCVQNILE